MRFFLALISLLLWQGSGNTQSSMSSGWMQDQAAMVDTQLIADHVAVVPGQTFHVGLAMDIEPGWHTYWINPGDSGEATTVSWRLPDGVIASEIVWPAPSTYPFGPLMNYGYGGQVVLPMTITLPDDYSQRFVELRADVSWLVCEEVCIPESAELELFLSVSDVPRRNDTDAALIQSGLDRVPADLGLPAGVSRQGEGLILTVSGFESLDIREVQFFPFDGTVIKHAAPQELAVAEDGLALWLWPTPETRSGLTRAPGGVLTYEVNTSSGWQQVSTEIWPEPGRMVVEITPDAFMAEVQPVTAGGLVITLILAFIGGLVLNLMPCVFPVLSIKAIGFVERAHSAPLELRRHGLLFLAGVLSTFLVLALVLLGFKALGNPIGWGFQLQNPLAVSILAMVMFTIGLNLLGLFEVGAGLQGFGDRWANMGGDVGAFTTGLLAVVVAAPCIGPFAAGALGLALSQPGFVLILVSLMLGMGLALPYLLLSFFPALLKWLPKPGAWMNRFKQFLAFPMFGAAVWLVWVLSLQSGAQGLLMLLIGFVAIAFIIWSIKLTALAGRLASIAGAVALLFSLYGVAQGNVVSRYEGEPWSQDRVDMLIAEGRPVFIDFTAAWCVSCQFNKQVTLSSNRVVTAFEQNDVVVLIADWTNRDDAIAQAIRGYGAAGIPLYVYYRPGQTDPVILPPLLSADDILEAVAGP